MDFVELLERWPGPATATIARDLEISYWTVRSWQNRNWIPSIWWDDLIQSAHKHGVIGVTYAILRTIESDRWHERRAARDERRPIGHTAIA